MSDTRYRADLVAVMRELFRHSGPVNRFLRSVMKDVKPHSGPLKFFHHPTLRISISDPDSTSSNLRPDSGQISQSRDSYDVTECQLSWKGPSIREAFGPSAPSRLNVTVLRFTPKSGQLLRGHDGRGQ